MASFEVRTWKTGTPENGTSMISFPFSCIYKSKQACKIKAVINYYIVKIKQQIL